MNNPILKIRALRKQFGRLPVLNEVNLSVFPGEHIGLVGNNGQGKTTLLRLVLGLLETNGGEILLDGQPVGIGRTRAQRRLVGYLPESVAFYPHLKGQDTLRLMARLKGAPPDSAGALLELVGLGEHGGERVKTYSKGMRQRLGLAQALLGEPRLLLLDEPTNGLDPQGSQQFYAILAKLREAGVAMLTASHLLAEIAPHLDSLSILKGGVIQQSGTVAQLTEQARLPVKIRFALSESPEAMPAELARLGATPVLNGHRHSFEIQCPPSGRLEALRQVLRHEQRLEHLTVADPGLDEVFHHYQEQLEAPADNGEISQ